MKQAFLKLIRIYQKFISANLGFNCRFYPSCSSYTVLVIEKYGMFRGLKKGIWRILKCHPFNKGGLDLP